MGRIKTALVKRVSKQIVEKMPDLFNESFEDNKKPLKNTLPSKRMRNTVAGYITRIKKNAQKINLTKENQNE